jgi:hypothetical protein
MIIMLISNNFEERKVIIYFISQILMFQTLVTIRTAQYIDFIL